MHWQEIDTLLLDMDGTLLDLAFDNFFWRELVPARYSELRAIGRHEAEIELIEEYDAIAGSLAWYCLDHWTRKTGLEIRELKWAHRHLIAYLPGVIEFLRFARRRGKEIHIVTNAHPDTLSIKIRQTGLDRYVDGMTSSHVYGAPKENRNFWERLRQDRPFDAERSLVVEDNLAVIAAARASGVRHTLAIRRPDSGQAPRDFGDEHAVDGVADVVDSLV